jgi:hypothetical protein
MDDWKFDLRSIAYEDLICLALRHRWIPYEGRAGVLNGDKIILWDLKCDSGCQCTAQEWRDLFGNRIPGTQRQYSHTDSYKRSTGYTQGEYFAEIQRRQRAARRASKIA